jgi:long-chain acyl-CoA synthetase
MSALRPILRNVIRHPRSIAVIDDRGEYSFLKLGAGALFVAREVRAMTERKHVGIMLPTCAAFPMAMMGCWFARRVVVPFNFLLSREELDYVIRDSEVDTIITIKPMLEHIGGEEAIPEGVKLLKLEDMKTKGIPPLRWPPRAADDDLAAILYTSGTSGRPKGVMLTHGNLCSNAKAGIKHAQITERDTFLGVLPQFHSFGLTALTLIPLYQGSKVVYTARFVPRKIVELVEKHRPRIFIGIPSMYGALLSLRDAVYAGFLERFGIKILEGYGLTETSPVTNWSLPEKHREHAVGPALPDVDIRTIDDEGKLLEPGSEGEIIIAGPNVMAGYFKLQDETDKAFIQVDTPDAGRKRFFRTGDIGRVDEDGFLFITGRKKELIIVGGENVTPREIEEVLNAHASVHAAAVIGRKDDTRGEVPLAFVELEEDAEFDAAGLRNWCRERLAGYKVPREIRQIGELPRSATGKVLRRKLTPEMGDS